MGWLQYVTPNWISMKMGPISWEIGSLSLWCFQVGSAPSRRSFYLLGMWIGVMHVVISIGSNARNPWNAEHASTLAARGEMRNEVEQQKSLTLRQLRCRNESTSGEEGQVATHPMLLVNMRASNLSSSLNTVQSRGEVSVKWKLRLWTGSGKVAINGDLNSR